MRSAFISGTCGALLCVAVSQPVAAAQGTSTGCLTPAQVEHNKNVYDMERRTSIDDPMPIFDPTYFVGSWDYAWDGPDSPLGPGGSWSGVLTFTHLGGCNYEGQMRGSDGDEKPFTRTIKFSFDATKKRITWIETDSHGYTFDKSGVVGGELGGVFQHHWEEVPQITVGGEKVRLKGTTIMPSPAMHRADMWIATGDGPFMRFGTAMFSKQLK